ncbi:Hematopoietic lineage cell-specific protein isoform 1 [Schistosoma japonicum]|uniref:Hematopoietic lineage cell-specific protein isoform 1 n=1 Tax=Schistosoma japonicum TaxID=6182 RepID=A0A4Z2D4X2_SCHJA|nr:Hematopoietic lineage cell-specific protein isoform 1 [Schistosoma japonicum]TNN11532.1 Hematopoietic lineage cell-specific protein isoform 1 [Schistosoma japonicum]TNN11533.1 Hematopoietic lineage cell-specific protein isoform 1 [Schistosoma japonicum]TNN11534.1 Hematopoietic lineage cell-specific protein isoform 1 [Schistosoma japonicum]TNN11535.1 Hematopoietic lineage cell-specific protein isoform 1 [Schistosoma japonicum]
MSNNINDDDDWETEPDFVNDVTEKEQRWGSKTVAGSGHQASIDMLALKEEVKEADRLAKLKIAPKPSYGYGGKFGVEKDRMDKSAVDWSHIEVTEKHASQRDYAKGFGGKFGVERDRQDKSSVGWNHKETVEKHPSQKDYSVGFGGKYGVQTDRQDKSALGWDHHEKASHHPSQVDYAKGFGGKFGVQTDRVDSSSLGWNDANQTELHPSQMKAPIYKPDGGLSSIRAQFEQSNQSNTLRNPSGPSLAQQRVREEQARWEAERKQREHEVEQSREKINI